MSISGVPEFYSNSVIFEHLADEVGTAKFANGLMVQWGKTSKKGLAKGNNQVTVTFSEPFVGKAPIIQTSLRLTTVANSKRYFPTVSEVGLTTAKIGIYNNGDAQSSTTNNTVYWSAWGRWE